MRDDELMHFGVLGMKWGIRRYQPYSVKPRGSGKGGKELIKTAKKIYDNSNFGIKMERSFASKNRRKLSDDDLQNRITRLEKEKRLKELTNADLHPGRETFKNLYRTYGQTAVKGLATAALVSTGLKIANELGFNATDERVGKLIGMVTKKK